MTRYGLGRTLHTGFNLYCQDGYHARLRLTPVVTFAAISANWVSKLSFFITLIRVVSARWQKVVLWVLMTTSTASLIFMSFVMAFARCHDWSEYHSSIACKLTWHAGNFTFFASIYATAMVSLIPWLDVVSTTDPTVLPALKLCLLQDFILSLVPSVVMWKLKMPRHEKVAIICALSTGCL